MAVTINDVAREAGVSITTVSRVFNNNYPVKKETREKIEEAIQKLNYKPNTMARSLITRKSSVIGVLIPGLTNLFFPTIVEAIEETMKNNGYSINLCNTEGEPENEIKLIEDLMARQIDGIIVIAPPIDNLQNGFYEKISTQLPLIIVNGCPDSYSCNFVSYDEKSATLKAFQYLRELGHEKIAFVRGYKSFSYDLKERLYKDMIKNQQLPYEKIINVGKGNSIKVVEKTQNEIETLIQSAQRPTAIFTCNDLMAVGAINACSKVGVSVPKDISIIGFDNTLLSQISHPKLTTVDLKMNEIGYRAAIELLDVIKNDFKGVKKIVLEANLVLRESCGEFKIEN